MNLKNTLLSKDGPEILIVILLLLSIQETMTWLIRGVRLYEVIIVLVALKHIIVDIKFSTFLFAGKWILFSILLFFVYYIINFGNQEDTLMIISAYSKALPFFIIGLYWGINKKLELIEFVFSVVFIISLFNLIPYTYFASFSGKISKELANEFFNIEGKLIIFWPYTMILGFTGFSQIYYGNSSIIFKRFSQILLIILIITGLVSGYTAVFVIMLITYFGSRIILVSKRNLIKSVITVFAAFIITYLTMAIIASGSFGELGGTSSKINSFMKARNATTIDRSDLLDQATSTRWTLLDNSLESISSSPLYGKGFRWQKHWSEESIASQHSSIIDGFAYFGIFSIIVLLIYIGFLRKTYQAFNNEIDNNIKSKLSYFYGIQLALFIINFTNPYFYTYIDYYIFLIGGWITGYLTFIEKNNVMNKYTQRQQT